MKSSPSFNTHSCINNIADIANRVVQELQVDKGFNDLISFSDNADDDINELDDQQGKTQDDDEFEFPVIFPDDSSFQTDNIIDNHQISPRYPLFDRSLLLNVDLDSSLISNLDSESAPAPNSSYSTHVTPVTTLSPAPAPAPAPVASSSATRLPLSKLLSEDRDSTTDHESSSTLVLESNEDLNSISPETYCVWKPQAEQERHSSRGKHKKSNSISISDGTPSKRWKVRDLLKRSYSDDSKHTSSSSSAVLFSPPPKPKTGKDGSSSVVVFSPPSSRKPISNEKVKKPEKSLKTTAASMGGSGCANHKPEDKTPAAYKAKIGNIRLPAFLPYRQDQHQVDAFANHYKWVNCK